MKSKFLRDALVASALLLTGLAGVPGCGKDTVKNLVPNVPPTVELTNAPVKADQSNPYFYAYRVNWSGYDPDGRIDHYEFTVDPAPGDTTWSRTTRNEEVVFFRASKPDPKNGNNPRTASDFHTFVIKAVDDDGDESPRKRRDFYSFTIAPTVLILNPTPQSLLSALVTPSVRIDWTGSDIDGQFSQKPVKYKYKLLDLSNPANTVFRTNPDSLRIQESATDWAGWDSTSADTQFVQFTNLTPEKNYLFALIGFDEAGAYSPEFSLNSNCLQFTAGLAASNGPRIHFFNTFVDFVYISGGYSTDPLREVRFEIPSRRPITVNWEAFASPGSRIQSFRWMVDGNINDQTQRPDEAADFQFWSQASPTMPNSVVLPGFNDGDHRFYLECSDNNNQKSLGILRMTSVSPSFDRNLLVVDDTRREVDKFPDFRTNPSAPNSEYTDFWPSAAELDTFLYARGGVPWKFVKRSPGTLSYPGVLAGYSFDTLGTRLGLENPANGVLLSKIGQYRNLLWLMDGQGAQVLDSDPVIPVTALATMSKPGRASTLAAYTQLGGRVWLMGGGAAFSTLRAFDKTGNNVGQTTVFSSATQFGELAPSRIMYDGAHWQSALGVVVSGIRTFRNDYTIGTRWDDNTVHDTTLVVTADWQHFDTFTRTNLRRPDYSHLPDAMRWKVDSQDSLPPTRSLLKANLYFSSSFPCEYLKDPNSILEDVDPKVDVVREEKVLDTLMVAKGSLLLTNNAQTGQQVPAPTMTYYHGSQARQFVFSGFAPWSFAREDCIALVDFVLQDLWGMTRLPVDRSPSPASLKGGGTTPVRSVTPSNRTANARGPASSPTRE